MEPEKKALLPTRKDPAGGLSPPGYCSTENPLSQGRQGIIEILSPDPLTSLPGKRIPGKPELISPSFRRDRKHVPPVRTKGCGRS